MSWIVPNTMLILKMIEEKKNYATTEASNTVYIVWLVTKSTENTTVM